MLKFFFRKALYDLWDNILPMLPLNAAYVAMGMAAWFGPGILFPKASLGAVFAWNAAWWILGCVWSGGVSSLLAKAVDGGRPPLRKVFAEALRAAPTSALYGILMMVAAGIAVVSAPFYANVEGFFGVIAAAIALWLAFMLLVASVWYFPLRSRLGDGPFAALKKAFILFFANTSFSLLILALSAGFLALSMPLGFLVPGFAGTLALQNVALRVLMLKYDWIEANPEAAERRLPWDEILKDEKESLGKRGARSFILPWTVKR